MTAIAKKANFKRALSRVYEFLMPILAMLAALFLGGIVLYLLKVDPIAAYSSMAQGAFGSVHAISQTLVRATPLLFAGLGIVIAYRSGVINIGAEGQIIAGALATTAISVGFPNLPRLMLLPLALLIGMLAGAIWGWIPGILKARLEVNEILTTIMMNSIAAKLANYLLSGPMIDPKEIEAGTFIAQSAKLPEQAWLTRLIPKTLLNTGSILAFILAIVVYIFLWRTTIGYRIRAVGSNIRASRYAGIKIPRYQALSLTLAGAFAGLGGAVEVLGVFHRMVDGLSGGNGFTAIVVALFGGLHPIGAIPASILFGGLLVGGDKMQRATQTPTALVGTILGAVVLFVIASQIWSRRQAQRRELYD